MLKLTFIRASYRKIIFGAIAVVATIFVAVLFIGPLMESSKEAAISDDLSESALSTEETMESLRQKNQELIEGLAMLQKAIRHRQVNSAPVIPVTESEGIVRTIEQPADFNSYIPLGTTILVQTLNRIQTSESPTPVVATIPYTMALSKARRIEKGSRFIGISQANFDQKRVYIHFHHMVTPDFREIPIDAEALDPFGAGGLTGTYHTNDLERLLAIFGLNLVGAISDISQDRQADPTGIPFRRLSAKNIMLEGSSRTLKQETERQLSEYSGHKDESIEIDGRSYLKVFFNKGFYTNDEH